MRREGPLMLLKETMATRGAWMLIDVEPTPPPKWARFRCFNIRKQKHTAAPNNQ